MRTSGYYPSWSLEKKIACSKFCCMPIHRFQYTCTCTAEPHCHTHPWPLLSFSHQQLACLQLLTTSQTTLASTSHFYTIHPSEGQHFIFIPYTWPCQFTSAILSAKPTAPFSAQHNHSQWLTIPITLTYINTHMFQHDYSKTLPIYWVTWHNIPEDMNCHANILLLLW